MSLKYKVLIGVLALATAYACGRWMSPTKIVTQIQTVEIEKKTEDKQKDEHKKTIIVKKPDGTTTTTITDDTKSQDQEKDDTTITQDEKKEVDYSSAKTTVAMLARVSVSSVGLPTYGVLVSRPLLGPLTVGAFGFQDKSIGLALGLTF